MGTLKHPLKLSGISVETFKNMQTFDKLYYALPRIKNDISSMQYGSLVKIAEEELIEAENSFIENPSEEKDLMNSIIPYP